MTQPPLPPQSPPILEYADTKEGIREIASRQRAINLCILIYLICLGAQFVLPPPLRLILAIAFFAIALTATVCVFLLCTKLYGTGIGILIGLLTLIPCAGLITLLVVNAKATSLLRKAGLTVGLLGAEIPPTF